MSSAHASPTSTRTVPRLTAAGMAAATPVGRERFVDLLRAGSLAVVVLGHWLMAVVSYSDGRFRGDNLLLLEPWTQWLTWVLQVMPIFFLVGGFANAASWTSARRDGVGYGEWVAGRARRLGRPAAAFAVVWASLAVLLRLVGVEGDVVTFAGSVVGIPLWFLAVYLVIIAVAPVAVAAHERFGLAAVAALAVAAGTVDVLRLGAGVEWVGALNFAFVWLAPHQLGVAWRSGALDVRPTLRWWLVAGGLVALVLLTTVADYPRSMVGGPGGARTNNSPPSVALVALGAWQAGLVLVLRDRANRWLEKPAVWVNVVRANAMAMTLYLWHLTALVAATVALVATGIFPEAPVGSGTWWALRLVWLGILAALLVPLVALFARVEVAGARRLPEGLRASSGGQAVAGSVAIGVAMSLLARQGLSPDGWPLGLPVPALAALAVGLRLLAPTDAAGSRS